MTLSSLYCLLLGGGLVNLVSFRDFLKLFWVVYLRIFPTGWTISISRKLLPTPLSPGNGHLRCQEYLGVAVGAGLPTPSPWVSHCSLLVGSVADCLSHTSWEASVSLFSRDIWVECPTGGSWCGRRVPSPLISPYSWASVAGRLVVGWKIPEVRALIEGTRSSVILEEQEDPCCHSFEQTCSQFL